MSQEINQLADLIDEIAMSYYELLVSADPHVDYLVCLTKALEAVDADSPFVGDEFSDQKIKALKQKIKLIKQLPLTKEDARRALLLLEIKALKHKNMTLDLITPDMVGAVFSFLLNLENKKSPKTVLDLGMGLGNLSTIIATTQDVHTHIVGIEQDLAFCNYVCSKANFLGIHMNIRMEDCLNYNFREVDSIIADIPNYEYQNEYYHSPLYDQGVRNFSYLLIERHINSGNQDTLGYYLVDSDFFNYQDNQLFKREFEKQAYIKAIIVLPPKFFQKQAKMVLVVAKTKEQGKEKTNIFRLPNLSDQVNWQKTLINIRDYMGEK